MYIYIYIFEFAQFGLMSLLFQICFAGNCIYRHSRQKKKGKS